MRYAYTLTGRVPSKKNSRINTRSGRSFPSRDYALWHADALGQVALQQVPAEPVALCENLLIELRFPTLGRADLTNKAESIMDLLVDAGVLRDDCWRVVPMMRLSGFHDKDNPGARVIVWSGE